MTAPSAPLCSSGLTLALTPPLLPPHPSTAAIKCLYSHQHDGSSLGQRCSHTHNAGDGRTGDAPARRFSTCAGSWCNRRRNKHKTPQVQEKDAQVPAATGPFELPLHCLLSRVAKDTGNKKAAAVNRFFIFEKRNVSLTRNLK